jgi:hypothetical protein
MFSRSMYGMRIGVVDPNLDKIERLGGAARSGESAPASILHAETHKYDSDTVLLKLWQKLAELTEHNLIGPVTGAHQERETTQAT